MKRLHLTSDWFLCSSQRERLFKIQLILSELAEKVADKNKFLTVPAANLVCYVLGQGNATGTLNIRAHTLPTLY